MKPYYEHSGITIYHGDCREMLPLLPADSVDVVVTSPPYNLGSEHHTGNTRHSAYADDLPEGVYQDQQVHVLTDLFRVTRVTGSTFYNHKVRIKQGSSIHPYAWIQRTPWVLKQECVWFNRSQNFDKCRFYPMTERVYWLGKSVDAEFVNAVNSHDLFQWTPEGTKQKHTRSFPYALPSTFIACVPNAKVILDPYSGSGTTLRAAKDAGRTAIGIEINERYCEIAAKRLSQEVLFLEDAAEVA